MKIFSFKNKHKAKCPYCQHVFEKAPMSKIKCPNCENTIFVINDGSKPKLFTEQDHEEYIIIHYLDSIGFSKKRYNEFKADFIRNAAEEVEHKDILWAIFGYLLREKAKTDDYAALATIYGLMANMQIDEPAEYLKLKKLAGKMELLSFQSQHGTELEVEILPTKNSCDYCKTFSRKKFTLQKALDELPLPLLECDQGMGCRCCYGITPKD